MITQEQRTVRQTYMRSYTIVSLTGETYWGGLASILSAKCSVCRMEIAFPTSSKVASLSRSKQRECNVAAVWGQMVTGGGHTPLAEAMPVLGVPVMSKKSFIAIEKEIGNICSTYPLHLVSQIRTTA